jgi:hypothetical protein
LPWPAVGRLKLPARTVCWAIDSWPGGQRHPGPLDAQSTHMRCARTGYDGFNPEGSGATAGFRVVICGGGIAGVEGLLRLRRLACDAVDVTLISPQKESVYRPLAVFEPFLGVGRRVVPCRASRLMPERGGSRAAWIRSTGMPARC